jgi:hypothetical protein
MRETRGGWSDGADGIDVPGGVLRGVAVSVFVALILRFGGIVVRPEPRSPLAPVL